MRARPAALEVAAAIAQIYSERIEDRVAAFDTRPRSAEEMHSWFDGTHPILGIEANSQVIAFASTFTYRPRDCYRGLPSFPFTPPARLGERAPGN
jgi:phosphinothricin acetyltransferase